MKILINASCTVGGGVQVCDSLIRILGEFPEHSFIICASVNVQKSFGDSSLPPNAKLIGCPHVNAFQRIFGSNPAMDKIVSENKVDAVFTVFGPSYWRPNVPHLCGFAVPHYVYPESEFLKQIPLKEKIRLFLWKRIQMRSFLKDTDALVSENPEVSERLMKIFGFRESYTVYNTFNPVFSDPGKWDRSLTLPDFEGTTILVLASYYPHKNLEIIVPVTHFLIKKYPDFKFRFILSIRKEQLQTDLSGLEEHFIFLDRVSISQCPYLYQQSQIMFLPTLLECFSATWVEAMFMKTPILTSDLPFAHGICGNAAMYVDPYLPEKIADSIFELSSSPNLQKELIQNGTDMLKKFANSQSRMAAYLKIIEKLITKQ